MAHPWIRSFVACLVALLLITSSGAARADDEVIGPGRFPRLTVDAGGTLHLLYQESAAIRYRTHAGGWSDPEEVPGSSGVGTGKAARHRMAVQVDGVHVWVSFGFGYDTDILLSYRDPGGWHGPETACARSVRPWEYGAVAARSTGEVLVFCQVDDLWFARRSAAGAWDAPVELFTLSPSTAKHVVAGADASDHVHAFCRQGPVHYIRHDGASWSPHYHLETAASTELPAFALDASGGLHLVWQDWVNDNGSWYPATVRYATGTEESWSNGNAGVVVHTYAAESNPPEVAVDPTGGLRVTWIEGSELLLARSVDGGDTWSPAEVVASDVRPVEAGGLENDLRTAPSLILDGVWHLVYENDAGDLVHHTEVLAPPDDARFVTWVVPAMPAPGIGMWVSLTFENAGTTTWSRDAGYVLGALAPPGNTTWGASVIELPADVTVPPGAQHSFEAVLVAPAAQGTYDFQWQLRRGATAWFGEPSPLEALVVLWGDAGVAADAAPTGDAAPSGDAAPANDAGPGGDQVRTACDCASSPRDAAPLWLLLLALTVIRRRRP